MTTRTLDPARPELSPAKRALLDAILAGRAGAAAIPRRAGGGEAPLSSAQERLWFLYRLGQGASAAYHIANALRLSGGADEAALERALGEIVRRHASLRTTFREVDGVPLQAAAPFAGFALPVDDLSALDEPERETALRAAAAAHAAEPFDLGAGPPFRARLLRLGGGEHALLLCMHHIVGDGWSMGVFFRELWTLYGAYLEGREPHLPAPPVEYADYAVWQREQARGGAEARQLAWWKAELAGAPELLELPADHPRPPVPSFRGATVPVEVPAEAAEGLRELARREGATLFMVVLAAFQALLARYAGRDDVVVGTLVAGRSRPEVEGLIGLFMNTLVLRGDLSGDPTVRQLVGRARDRVLGAQEHQDVPFERVVAEVQPERSLSHAALFQVLFQLDDADDTAERPRGLQLRGVDAGPQTAKLDLALLLHAGPRGIRGVLEYGADLFERGTARRMAEHLERILEQAAADPDRRLSRLELMSRSERARVLEWNRTTARYPADRCIHQLFEAQAAETPDAPALVFESESLTYRELDARANRLANHLRRLGVGPEVRVGICLERSPELMVAILGVMKAGGAYVPADPAHPAERIAYVAEDAGVALMLTQRRLVSRLPASVPVLALDDEDERARIAAESAEAPSTGVTSENLCYVIYTSGSTGRPKGVAMHHHGVCNYLHWGVRAYGAGQGAGAPVFSSMAVDLTITNLLPLFAGKPVRLLSEHSPVEALAAALREGPGFGLVKITPVHLSLLTPMLTPDEARRAARTLVIGADFLNAETTLFWQEHAPGVRLMNEYGPTETVVGCSAYVVPPGKHRAGAVPVGHPIQNITFYVLDARLQPVSVGLPGELYIGGVGVARGYLGRPGLTGEKFVPDPFAGAGARMYRTGDRARWQADGNLLILGRTDNQVKIRGYRVELGEVEAALRRRDGVRECLAVVREDAPGDRRLVAYVVGEVETEVLRDGLRSALPEYMVPDAVVRLDALPTTATGKIDPKTLPAPVYGAAGGVEDEPRNYVEAQLIQVWEEQLGVRGIGATQSFFHLGGNSLLALRLFTRVNRMLGCDLPLATLFSGATVRNMADAVLEQRRAAPAPVSSVVPLQPNGDLPPLFLVHAADRNVMGYVNLVRHLGAGQPAYGVRDTGDDLGRPISRIAAEHVAAIRRVRPRGPYHLVGWSFGGTVAFEMARQLEAAGEAVDFVGLLDTMAPHLVGDWTPKRDADVVLGMAREAAEQMRRPFDFDAAELEGLDFDAQVERVAGALHAQGAVPARFDAASLAASCRNVRDRARSGDGYAPGPVSGAVTLFRAGSISAREERFLADRPAAERETLGWTPYAAGGVRVHAVPGTHAMLGAEPNVRVLAERMREALAAVRALRASAPSGAGIP